MNHKFPQHASDLISSFLGGGFTGKDECQKGYDQVREVVEIRRGIVSSKQLNVENKDAPKKVHTQLPSLIREWKPCTTSSLLLNMPQNVMESCSVLDNVFGRNFLNNLRSEIHERKLIDRLTPAKTTGDHKVNDLLMSAGITSSNLELGRSSTRGDLSVIIPRSFRSTSTFQSRYPFLFHMVSSIECTATKHLERQQSSRQNNSIRFDTSLTSVQLAMYPGDGKSGYTRHCDTGAACNHESTTKRTAQRIITCVYYVTDDDFSEDDGGCLRIFNGDNHDYHDIIPYADRLVVFRSDLVEHQVLPSVKKPRTAITVWLYGQLDQSKQIQVPLMKNEIVDSQASSNNTFHSKNRLFGTSSAPLPIDSDQDTYHDSEKIFVSIPSYRDPETQPTIVSLIENASSPERIFVGVVYQYDTKSTGEEKKCKGDPCLPSSWILSNLRSITLDYRHATGPCYARYLAQSLHRGEEYILSIDSHMRFRKGWDKYLIQQLQKCNNPQKAILTTYPVGYSLPNYIPNETRATILVPWKFDENGMLRQKGRLLHDSTNHQDSNIASNNNIRSLLFAAGFNFSTSHMISECPYDGTLSHLFFGEELSMAIRLFTHGFDCFAPPTTVCYHLWSREHRATFQADIGVFQYSSRINVNENTLRQESLQKVQQQLIGEGHGLGIERDVAQFWDRMGIDFKARQISPDAQNIGLDPMLFVSAESKSSPTDNLLESTLQILQQQKS